jgi:hypothetical protein
VKTFKHRNFVEAVAFVNQVAEIAEAAKHHPDIDIRWSRVSLKTVRKVAVRRARGRATKLSAITRPHSWTRRPPPQWSADADVATPDDSGHLDALHQPLTDGY